MVEIRYGKVCGNTICNDYLFELGWFLKRTIGFNSKFREVDNITIVNSIVTPHFALHLIRLICVVVWPSVVLILAFLALVPLLKYPVDSQISNGRVLYKMKMALPDNNWSSFSEAQLLKRDFYT